MKIKKTVKKVLTFPKRVVSKALDRFEAKDRAMQAHRKARDTKMIERNFGSVENYNKVMKQMKKK